MAAAARRREGWAEERLSAKDRRLRLVARKQIGQNQPDFNAHKNKTENCENINADLLIVISRFHPIWDWMT
jgi:hypothetical protein